MLLLPRPRIRERHAHQVGAMANNDSPDLRVTLLDVMIGITEFAVLLGLLAAALRGGASRGAALPMAAVIYVTIVASLPLAGAWWLAVRFANDSGRRHFGQRLAAHLLSLLATAGLMLLTLWTCGLPVLLAVFWRVLRPRAPERSDGQAESTSG
jgi:hypothetical protein